MFQSSRKTMKWATLLKDIKEKVGLAPNPPPAESPSSASLLAVAPSSSAPQRTSSAEEYAAGGVGGPAPPARGERGPVSEERGKNELEMDFKRYWEEFRSSSSEKDKEMSLNMAVDIFCRLLKRQADVAQLVTTLVEAHIFAFVIGRAFVTDIEKLRIYNKTKSLHVANVLNFFSEVTKDGICPGSNLLYSVEVLVSAPVDKQPLLDSGIFCCLIHILNALLNPNDDVHRHWPAAITGETISTSRVDTLQGRRFEVEGSVVHIMKALASHPSAAISLIEDDSLQLLFQMVANGSITVFSLFRKGIVPLHTIQLHRHAMQILGLLLVNDNGSTAKYIHKHHLIKVLLTAVKDFNPEEGDSAYTMGIVDLLLECVELSHRPDAGSVRLREDIHNAHGYQFLVQFALMLSSLQRKHTQHITLSKSLNGDCFGSGPKDASTDSNVVEKGDSSPAPLSPSLSRLLDVLVNLAQMGNLEPIGSTGRRGAKATTGKSAGLGHSIVNSDNVIDEVWEKGSSKIRDLEAIQMLQDIFLKSDCVELQAEVLNRIFKLFSSHPDNYMLCQQLRTVPLFILNMGGFPLSLQGIILKILEYAVTVVNCVPEQELLSLCCLLQQPTTLNLKQVILSFFVKLISFDQQYKKVLREVGVMEVLIDDLKQHKFISGIDRQSMSPISEDKKSSSNNFKKNMDSNDVILSSPKLTNSSFVRFSVFENEETTAVAWDCLVSLLKKAESNQLSFRSANGFTTVLPFLVSDIHRPGLLRMMSCLMIEDVKQVHPEELGAVIEILKSGMVTNTLGSQFKLLNDAKCDLLGALWRILVANSSAQKVFCEATGFSLLLTTLHGFQCDNELPDVSSSQEVNMKVFSFLLRVMTAAVCNNAVSRLHLHTVISSPTFHELLLDSNLLCIDWENQAIQLFLELALEIILPPSTSVQPGKSPLTESSEAQATNFLLSASSGTSKSEKERIYNGGAIGVLIRSLSKFSPKVRVEFLVFIEKLASSSPFNKESLTSIGCVGLLLEMIHPFLKGFSPLIVPTLRIVQVLGAYRLSTSEVRILVRYILQYKSAKSGLYLVEMMEKLIQTQDTRSDGVSLAPFVEMDLSRKGHASVQVSLGERTWPPAAGYSFVCWFQYHTSKGSSREQDQLLNAGSTRTTSITSQSGGRILRFFSVGSVDDVNSFFAELYLEDGGILTLATSNSCSLSFSGLELEEGKWHHLAVVHSKPNALAGLFQASVANVYLNGKLRHTGKLGYSPSPVGKSLQVTIGTPLTRAKVCELSWRFRCCYLFEEVLTSGGICFMYILGKGYRGIFQDADLLQFVPNQACGGGSMAILDSFDNDPSTVSNVQRLDTAVKQGTPKLEGSEIVWDLERLGTLSLQVIGKKLIFAFDGTSSESFKTTGALAMLNLVDPMSAAASPIGGIPRFGRLSGDSYICHQYVIGDSIRAVGGMTVILFLVEASETKDMLHASLLLLACALEQNPQNVIDMQACRGYHLLAIFLRRKMPLFDVQSLEIFFQIAACEAHFVEPQKFLGDKATSPVKSPDSSFVDLPLPKLSDEVSSVGSQADLDDFSLQKDTTSHFSELENTDLPTETANCIVLSNADMVEHVLLDWTLWVTAPVSIQLALLGFLERMVSIHWYRSHNLTLLRRINLVQHLMVTLQRGDVEVQVLEKLVVLLGVILEDGFLVSELEVVVRFVIMTFDPPELRSRQQIVREAMGKHVIVRNMLLEMLIDLQVTLTSDEQLEHWQKIVSVKLITFFLDEAVHPTSMRWIMTLLGVCLTSSLAFAQQFRASGGYQTLTRVLPGFYDSPEIYFTIFCLIFGKDVYPRVPEVHMGDFHALMSSDGYYGELKFTELLDSVIAMAKSTFDRLSMQTMLLHKKDNISQYSVSLVAELVEATNDVGGDLQVEALKHKTSARLMGGDATAPATATSILRFMVDLAKMCPSFSAICRRKEFLDTCVDLYFSCVRADCAVKMAKRLASGVVEEKSLLDTDDNQSTLHTTSSLPQEPGQSSKTTTSIRSFPQGLNSTSSEDVSCMQIILPRLKENVGVMHTFDIESIDQMSTMTSSTCDISHYDMKIDPDAVSGGLDSPVYSEKSNAKALFTPSSSPVVALPSWYSSTGSNNESKAQPSTVLPVLSLASEAEVSAESKGSSQGSSTANIFFLISPKVLVEITDSGYGGGPCSAGATAVLDFVALVLADIIAEQVKGSQYAESVLEVAPLYVDADTTLVFQGLCMSRLINFLERRLLRDDEEDEKQLDKTRWSVNLDALCWMIVDRTYMGAFSRPVDVLRTLEFLLSMLQLANKDGRIEEILPSGKSLLSITMGTRQLEPYILALLKNANRMIMYCFLPSFLAIIGEDLFLSCLGFQNESRKTSLQNPHQDDHNIDICTVLQLVIANKRLLLCPSNLDADLICCLCVNLFSLLRDQRQTARNLAVDIIKYMLLHRRNAFEDVLNLKSNVGNNLNIVNGGFDKLLTGNCSEFFEWFDSSEKIINKALEQNAALMWVQYMNGPAKLPAARIKAMEVRRKNEIGKRSRDASKFDLKHWETISNRRYALEAVRDAMSTELRVIRQDKYGWVLHAESEWEVHLQQLVHEKGIFPINVSIFEPEWQLCPIEGPYRMRKKLERCKFKVEKIQNVLIGALEKEEDHHTEVKDESGMCISESDSERFFNVRPDSTDENGFDGGHEYGDSFFRDAEDYKVEESMSTEIGWNDDRGSSINELSLHSVPDFGVKSSSSVQITDSINAKSELGSPKLSSTKFDDTITADDKSEKELNDNGEYLIRPYLEPFEKIRFKYNCERVVGLDKHDGIFLIGELSLYVIENFFIDDMKCICEKQSEDDLSVIDQALGVKKDVTGSSEFQTKSPSAWGTTMKALVGGRAWAYNGGAWGKEKVCSSGNLPHPWHMWKLDSVHELLKRDYQLRPVAVEIFSMDGCNDLLVFHKKEREEVFRNLVSMNLPRNNMLDATISGLSKHESNEGSRLFKTMAKSFSKRWQNGEISNFQYLMHLNTLAGRGYRDLTQYPVFPWVLADYESETLDLTNPNSFRKLDKPMGCQTFEGEEEFKKRYESWDDPDVPKFHYGSHYSSAGIVLFYLLRLPPFSVENQKLQGGQFDHADRLFNSVRDTWLSAAGKGNTSDVKELIPEFFYLPEFLENRFNLNLGEKQSGEKVGDVVLPPWAKCSAREFIRKHREALESDYVSENLHNWIDLIFGYKQRGKAAEEAVNVFYHYTYEGNVDIDSVSDPAMKASILAQINHFGQTPKQLFPKPHVKRRVNRKILPHPLRFCSYLVHREVRKSSSLISQIVSYHEKILIAGANTLLKPVTYNKYVAWGFPDRSLRFLSYDQDRLLSTHENLHGGNQIQCAGITQDGHVLVTGADDGVVSVWRISQDGVNSERRLHLERSLCAHIAKVTCLYVSQPHSLIVTGSDDCTVILWDLSSLVFVKHLPQFPASVSAVHVNDLTGEIVTAAGILLAVWSINGDFLAVINTSQLPSDLILSVTTAMYSDWQDTNWYVTGHQSGAVKVWNMVHCSIDDENSRSKSSSSFLASFGTVGRTPEYRLVLWKVLKLHKHPVRALLLTPDRKQLLSGDSEGHLLSWTLPDESLRTSINQG